MLRMSEKRKIRKSIMDKENVWELMDVVKRAERNIRYLKDVAQKEIGTYAHEKEAMSTMHLIEHYAYEMEYASRRLQRTCKSIIHNKANELIRRVMKTKSKDI